ncbi:hypothetical protein CH35J_012149 [Colletotrichum higginsianum]|uniref:Uncharacterized protein n=1 Tax=Colletotrichum higginsianum TaxID=80884 RepID=A0A4T0VDT1_9PEZI|nr:hypothetical protein CH35J_012149 [Colletotrichum higginsianum]
MSRSTPRKRGHARHSSASGHGPRPVQSDYESDAAHYIDSHPVPVPNPALFNRTNTDLNLSVLRRYLPPSTRPSPSPPTLSATPRACIFVLNRRGLENVILDLGDVADFEVVDEIYIFRLRGGEEDGSKVMGIWIHADKDDTRVMNAALITETLRHVRIAEEQNAVAGGGPAPQEELGPAMQAIGRRLSLSDLFGAQNGVKG